MDRDVRFDRNGMVVLSEDECMQRVRANGVGRIAVSVGALPAVIPINYAVRGGDVFFRTAPGTKLAAASRNAVVAFEVDHINRLDHSGWSVLIVGKSSEVVDTDELEALQDLPLTRWLESGDDTLVRISAELISGRELDALRPFNERRGAAR